MNKHGCRLSVDNVRIGEKLITLLLHDSWWFLCLWAGTNFLGIPVALHPVHFLEGDAEHSDDAIPKHRRNDLLSRHIGRVLKRRNGNEIASEIARLPKRVEAEHELHATLEASPFKQCPGKAPRVPKYQRHGEEPDRRPPHGVSNLRSDLMVPHCAEHQEEKSAGYRSVVGQSQELENLALLDLVVHRRRSSCRPTTPVVSSSKDLNRRVVGVVEFVDLPITKEIVGEGRTAGMAVCFPWARGLHRRLVSPAIWCPTPTAPRRTTVRSSPVRAL
mmetsp:Transcript_28469/g.83214  ORF Transcript_28469/g.83214 Transcript_28469/m.83214 type:complete len:274 (+) Transcript_28469:142-963(+)